MTFSIVARDAGTGEFGAATATGLLAVGALVPHAWAGLGAAATQGYTTNPLYPARARAALTAGKAARSIVEELTTDDPGRERRQFALVDAEGGSAAWSGCGNTPAQHHICGKGFAAAGNNLTGANVVEAMAAAFRAAAGHLALAERLVLALEAGQSEGGDARGTQSAAVYVVRDRSYALVDLRVDDHESPIEELSRLYTLWREPHLQAFLDRLPSEDDPGRS